MAAVRLSTSNFSRIALTCVLTVKTQRLSLCAIPLLLKPRINCSSTAFSLEVRGWPLIRLVTRAATTGLSRYTSSTNRAYALEQLRKAPAVQQIASGSRLEVSADLRLAVNR